MIYDKLFVMLLIKTLKYVNIVSVTAYFLKLTKRGSQGNGNDQNNKKKIRRKCMPPVYKQRI